ncbi:MAG: sensor histidine kinase [Rhodocyclales bacterium]|nr:sensor histidine kinase [Rhodocyclales bacterium]
MTPRRLHLSIAFVAAALLLAASLIAYLLRQQSDAFEAADWVSHSLDVRARLQQLLATIEDGPTQTPRALAMVVGLREKMTERPETAATLEKIAIDLGFGKDSARVSVKTLIGEETGLLADRRYALVKESRQARLALISGGGLVILLMAAAFAIVVRDNRQRRAAEDELKRSNEELEVRVAARTAEQRVAESRLRELSRRLLRVQEEERRTLARELHDEVGQLLGALKLNLKALSPGSDEKNAARIHDGLEIVDATIAQIRDRALDLRPALLDDLGLASALDWLCRQQAKRSGITISFTASPLPTLPPDLATAIYRIVQEGITNTLKHADASRMEIAVLTTDGNVAVSIIDDGRGFDSDVVAPGVGLPGMRERVDTLGGHLGLASAQNAGTRIDATFELTTHDDTKNQPAAR